MAEQTNIITCRVSKLDKKNINQNKIVCKFVARLLEYKILFEDIPTYIFRT